MIHLPFLMMDSVMMKGAGDARDSMPDCFEEKIPILAVLEGVNKDTVMLSKNSRYMNDIIAGTQELHPNTHVPEKCRPLLPKHIQEALGSFRMLSVAERCVGMTFDQLVHQQDAQYEAVLRVKQLYEMGYFDACAPEVVHFLRKLFISGLMEYEVKELTKLSHFENWQRSFSTAASTDIVKYANSLRASKDVPLCTPHESRYPVVVHARATAASSLHNNDFNPNHPICRAIIAGKHPLPPEMVVSLALRHLLPQKCLDELGPFQSIVQGAMYMHMTTTELTEYFTNRKKERQGSLRDLTSGVWAALPQEEMKLKVDDLITRGMLLRAPPDVKVSPSQKKRMKSNRDVDAGIRLLLNLPDNDKSGDAEVAQVSVRTLLEKRARDESERRAASHTKQQQLMMLSADENGLEPTVSQSKRARLNGPEPRTLFTEEQQNERDGFPSVTKPAILLNRRNNCCPVPRANNSNGCGALVTMCTSMVDAVMQEVEEVKRQVHANERLYGE